MKITVLGARGSMPATGKEYLTYGGNTTSYLIETDTQAVFLDAGTGILRAPATEKEITILLSHPHLDHVMGIPFCKAFFEPGRKIDIYGKKRGGLTAREQISQLMRPPLWPVGLEIYPADIRFYDIEGDFSLRDARIEVFENGHPGGCSAFKITSEGKSVVFSGDYEHDNGGMDRKFADFSRNADLLIYDAQYTEEEYVKKRSFGHSTPQKGLEIQRMSGARRILFTHHDPFHTDAQMEAMEKALARGDGESLFAREGEVICL